MDSQKVQRKIFVKTSFFFCLKSSYINKEVDSPGPTSKVLVTVSTQYTESNTKLGLQTTNLRSHFKKWEHIKPLLPSGGAAVASN